MDAQTTAFIITCEGPPLDYTVRVNLQSADIFVLGDGASIRLQLEASSEADALAQVKQILTSRPYVDFQVVGGLRVG